MGEAKKNFIDFIVDAQDPANEDLLRRFIESKNVDELKELFGTEYAVDIDDCEKLLKAKERLDLTEWPIPPAY